MPDTDVTEPRSGSAGLLCPLLPYSLTLYSHSSSSPGSFDRPLYPFPCPPDPRRQRGGGAGEDRPAFCLPPILYSHISTSTGSYARFPVSFPRSLPIFQTPDANVTEAQEWIEAWRTRTGANDGPAPAPPSFSILVEALSKAGLLSVLQDKVGRARKEGKVGVNASLCCGPR